MFITDLYDRLCTWYFGWYLYAFAAVYTQTFAVKYWVIQWLQPDVVHGHRVVLGGDTSVLVYGREDASTVLFMVPGGGFVLDRTGAIDHTMHVLSRELDILVIVCPYHLAPVAKFPQIHDAVRATFEDTAARFGFQEKSVFVGGASAGGSIAMDLVSYMQEAEMALAGTILWYMTPQMSAVSASGLKYQTMSLALWDYLYYIQSYTTSWNDIDSPRMSPLRSTYAPFRCLSFVSNRDIFRESQAEFAEMVGADVHMVDHRHGYLDNVEHAAADIATMRDFLAVIG